LKLELVIGPLSAELAKKKKKKGRTTGCSFGVRFVVLSGLIYITNSSAST
jgi:hypothetical protein